VSELSASEPRALHGRWRRVSTDACAQRYPVDLTVGPGSRYAGTRADDQGMVVWDAGTARMPDEATLTMSTASDEVVHYRLVVESADRFTVTDPEGCAVTYERVG
jgi:hypothetical protein